jgi:hypothetical protein
MARGQRSPIDLEAVHELQAQGMSQSEIARRLGVPRATLYDRLKQGLPVKATDVDTRGSTDVHIRGTTDVHSGEPPTSTSISPSPTSLTFRRCSPGGAGASTSWPKPMTPRLLPSDGPAHREAVHHSYKAEADAEHVTVTEVINRIIRHYYEG